METHRQSPVRCFGAFEVDAQAGELRKRGIRVPLSGQPLLILVALLENPGDLITRERLREQIWREGTFVDFEHGLNAAMNKLRRALGDSAEHPRYIETVTGRGYRFIGTLAEAPFPDGAGPVMPENRPPRRSVELWRGLAATAACVGVSFAVGWRTHTPEPRPDWTLTQLTSDPGISGSPVLSPDGKLVAYSSDRGLDGYLDLYIKQVAGGEPIRLTLDGAGNTTPDFSPDGSRIVFRSNAGGGGIFEIPAFGGQARLLARDGWNPKFSPDGSQVAYWIGAVSVAATVPGSGAVWVVPSAGGEPRRVGSNFTTARFPIWAPDGKHLLITGYTAARAFESSGIDWWLVPTDGGTAVRTGVYEALVRAGLPDHHTLNLVPVIPRAACWSADNKVLFSNANTGTLNIWQIGVSPTTGKVNGALERLTTGSANEVDASCATSGAVAFTSVQLRRDVWSLPFDFEHGTSGGVLERVTENPATQWAPSFSRNGRFLAFLSNHSGVGNIWIRELGAGRESSLASSSIVQGYPVSNASGSRIAFSVYEGEKRVVFVSAPGGTPEKLCEGCLRATDWSGDEKSLLVFGGNPYQINVLDLGSHRQTPLLKHPTYNLLYGSFSPDNKWVSFTARISPSGGRVAIAPVEEPQPVPESAWITIAEAAGDDYGIWSPDGKTLYFTSGRDGYSCLWAQRLEAASHRPVGDAFAVQHLHGRLSFEHRGWSVSADRIGLALLETTGNIWLMSRPGMGARAAIR